MASPLSVLAPLIPPAPQVPVPLPLLPPPLPVPVPSLLNSGLQKLSRFLCCGWLVLMLLLLLLPTKA
uniref:Uncharacterized protein n=1 Tax=Oryza glumipatula TaxID=40148 RepID=A0A0D9ZN74_9ORYZ